MAENPLLPHAKLRQLYALMQQARPLLPRGTRNLEAVLAPLAMHVGVGDRLLTSVAAGALHSLTASRWDAALNFAPATSATASLTAFISPLSLALGAAAALPLVRPDPVTFALLDIAQPMPHWRHALAAAHAARLPLILLLMAQDHEAQDRESKPASAKNSITWSALERVVRPMHFPVIPVDARDAVALYRVLQESTLRARTGGGPAAIWCTELASPRKTALAVMKRYLDIRGIDPQLS